MPLPDYQPFAKLVPRAHRTRLVAEVRGARDELGLSNAALGMEVARIIEAHNAVKGRVPLPQPETTSDIAESTNGELNTLPRAPRYIPGYLAWLCLRAPERAEAFCRDAGVPYHPYLPPEEDGLAGTGDSQWDRLIRRYGRFERLDVLLCDAGSTLVSVSRGEPVSGRPLRLGESFYFCFDAPSAGFLLSFQRYRRKWYPLPLGDNDCRLRISAGKQPVPHQRDGSPGTLSEETDTGLYGFGFLVTERVELAALFDRLAVDRPLPEELAASAGELIKKLPHPGRRIYRINIRITA